MQILRLALLLLCIVFALGCETLSQTWKPLGPFGRSGPIKELTQHPTQPNKIYASSEQGGLWVIDNYTDTAETWRPLTDSLENLQTRGFAISSLNPQVLVMGNGLGNLHISTNSGQSWSKIEHQSFGYIRSIVADDFIRLNEFSFVVASSEGLFRVDASQLAANNSGNTTVTQLRSGDHTDLVRDPVATNVLYTAQRNQGVYRSVNFGQSWGNSPVQTSSSSDLIKLSRPSNTGEIFVKEGATLMYKGNASVVSFQAVVGPTFDGSCSDVGYRNPFGGDDDEWCNVVEANPRNPNELIAAQVRIYSSIDGGLTWKNNGTRHHEDYHDILFVGKDILMANDGGVYNHPFDTDGSLKLGSKEGLNQGLNTFEFLSLGVNGDNAAGSVDHNGIQYTNNLNAKRPDWKFVNSRYGRNGLENDFIYPDIKNPTRFFMLYRDQQITRLNTPYSDHSDLLVFGPPQEQTNPWIAYRGRNINQTFNRLNYAIGTVAQDPRTDSNIMLLSSYQHAQDARTIDQNDLYEVLVSSNADRNPSGGPRFTPNADNPCSTDYCYENPVTNFPTWQNTYSNGNVPIVSIAFSSRIDGSVFLLDETGKVVYHRDLNNDACSWTPKTSISINLPETMRQLLVARSTPNTLLPVEPDLGTNCIDLLHFNSYNETLLAISHQKVYKIEPNQRRWKTLPFTLDANNKINSIAQHHKRLDHYFIATDRGVYESIDGGDKWRRFGSKLPNAPVMRIFTDDHYLYAATFGRGVWRVDLKDNLPP